MRKSEFDVFITVTGINHYVIHDAIAEGKKLTLRRERDNEFDKNAVAVYDGNKKIGYVANHPKTVREGSMNAAQLCEIMKDCAKAEVIEFTSYNALCRVDGLSDIDKMVFKAFEYYNECEYEAALDLFLELSKKYNSLFLMQYTADCLIKQGKYNQATPYLRKALKIEPNNETSLMMHGTVLKNTGDYIGAIKVFSRILEKTENKTVLHEREECYNLLDKTCKN